MTFLLVLVSCKEDSQPPNSARAPLGNGLEQGVTSPNGNNGSSIGQSSSNSTSTSTGSGARDSTAISSSSNNNQNSNATNSDLCPPGHYCEGGNKRVDNAKLCKAGYYCKEGETSPFGSGRCLAGYFCPEGSRRENQFPVGMGFFSLAGASEPKDCGTGFFCPNEINLSPTACTNAPSFAEYTNSNETSPKCAFRCREGYNLVNGKCLASGGSTINPTVNPVFRQCTIIAPGLSSGTCEVICPSGMVVDNGAANPLKSYSANCRISKSGSKGVCYGSNNSAFSTSSSSICDCEFSCKAAN